MYIILFDDILGYITCISGERTYITFVSLGYKRIPNVSEKFDTEIFMLVCVIKSGNHMLQF